MARKAVLTVALMATVVFSTPNPAAAQMCSDTASGFLALLAVPPAIGSTVTSIGNGVGVAEGARPGGGWLFFGYLFSAVSLGYGGVMVAIDLDADGCSRTPLAPIGVLLGLLGGVNLTLTIVAHTQPREGPSPAASVQLAPILRPDAGGAWSAGVVLLARM